jgi:predicted nucleic acid-binding protein
MVGTVALALEYEAVCRKPEHRLAGSLSVDDTELFITAVIALLEPIETWFLWRPQFRDPGDELVLEAGVNGQARAIVTFNRRDFLPGASRFGLDVLLPRDALIRSR